MICPNRERCERTANEYKTIRVDPRHYEKFKKECMTFKKRLKTCSPLTCLTYRNNLKK